MSAAPLLEARDLRHGYGRRGASGRLEVLRGVSLTLGAGSLVALVGRSGSGKSTLARLLALWERPDSGSVILEGERVVRPVSPAVRRRVQLVVQDPARSVSPHFTALEALTEPWLVEGMSAPERLRRARPMLARVELEEGLLERPASTLSGGQLLRLALGRALVCEPRVLILDETFAGLDLPLRSRMTDLLLALLEDSGLACLWITHDLAWVSAVADRLMILREGLLETDASAAPSAGAQRGRRHLHR
ncbi:MAG: ATP-binding cassette domain-containing protein [Acidobacteriota bacterium]